MTVIGGAIGGGSALGVGSLTKTITILPLVVTLAALLLPGAAAMKANDGKPGRYPESFPRFITKDDEEDEEEDGQ